MNVSSQFTLNFKVIVSDEVALEGLEGITLELLWKRIEKRISRSLTKLIYSRLWSFALQNEEISLFELPEPRQTIELINRTDFVCDSGLLLDPKDYLDGDYEYHPVQDDHGSCKDYATRQPIPKDELVNSSLDNVISKYGNRLVLVASTKERWKALVPHLPQSSVDQLSPVNYCILELIGKSRDNGQASIGKSNLLKVLNNSQLFYTRRLLCQLDLIAQVRVNIKIEGNSKYMKPYILKLKRFHVPALYVTPQQGNFVDLISHLKTKPNFADSVLNLTKLGLPIPINTKKKKKAATFFKREMATPKDGEPPNKKIRSLDHPNELIRLNIESDCESDSDAEIDEVPKPCEHMVGVNLYRQAYELILNAGTRGLSGMEFRQALGVGFYSARHILKWFREKNIVKEYYEEQGRQKLARYAIEITTIIDDIKTEKQKLLQYFSETSIKAENDSFYQASTSATPSHSMEDNSDSLNQTSDETSNTSYEFKVNVSEVDINEPGSVYKDLIDTKKKTSVRQLKFANAILKITREKRVIAGFRTLNTLAASEINGPCMDSKNFTGFLHKLAKDGQIKIYDLKWPTKKITKSTLIVCAPDVKLDDPIIKAKYNEICIRSNVTSSLTESKQLLRLATEKQEVETKTEKLKQNHRDRVLDSIEKGQHMPSLSLQRYRRIQRLHEFMFEVVYGGGFETINTHAPGYVSLANLIAHMPVRLVLGHFSKLSLLKLGTFTITTDMLDVKLKDTPPVLHSILSSRTFRTTVFETVNILATFGLVQVCLPLQITDDHHIGYFRYIFYLNRNATIVDTRGEWPRENVDLESLKQVYYLETQQDVKMYWKAVHDIAVNTKVTKHAKRWSLPPMKPHVPENEAPQNDTGQIYGDGAGACGLDSVYHIELPKHWEKISTEMLNKDNVRFLPRPKRARKKPPKKKPAAVKAKVAPKITNRDRIKKRNRAVKVIREPTVRWSSWEDNILVLVRTALAILSPTAQPGSIPIRNTVAKLLINNTLKLAGPCHKRLLIMENDVVHSLKRERLLKEAKRQNDLISKYQDLFTTLRYKHIKSEPNYFREGELACLELVFLLYKISKSETFLDRSTPCVASSLHDFNSKFEIKTVIEKRPFTLYLDVLPSDLQTLREAILMAMTSVEDMEVPIETTMKIFNCLSSYNESYLREAVELLRNAGVIAAKEKYLQAQLKTFSLQDLIRVTSSYMKAMSAYKLSAAYRRRQTGRLNTSFADEIAIIIHNSDLSGKVKGSPEVNCVSLELQAMNAIDIVTVAKPNVVEISRDGSPKDEDKNAEEATKSVVNAGCVELVKKVPVASLTELYDVPDFGCCFETLIKRNIVRQSNGAPPRADKIINYLRTAGQDGATFKDLQKIWTSDTKSLIRKLERLEKENFIAHVGFMENIVILSEFAHHWCIKVGEVSLIPCPWLTGDLVINKPFFIKWCATIVNKVFEYPGIAISKLVLEHFDVLAPRYVQQCCEFLQAVKCVNLNYVNSKSLGLFSEDDLVVDLIEYCKYGGTEHLVIFPVTNMLTKFSYYKSLILDDK